MSNCQINILFKVRHFSAFILFTEWSIMYFFLISATFLLWSECPPDRSQCLPDNAWDSCAQKYCLEIHLISCRPDVQIRSLDGLELAQNARRRGVSWKPVRGHFDSVVDLFVHHSRNKTVDEASHFDAVTDLMLMRWMVFCYWKSCRVSKERRFPVWGQKLLPGLEYYGKNYDHNKTRGVNFVLITQLLFPQ